MYRFRTRRKFNGLDVRNRLNQSLSHASAANPGEGVAVGLKPRDGLTGLASMSTLTSRLHDVYEHCENLHLRTPEAFALLVLDPDFRRRPALVQDAVRVLMADEALRTFTDGETVAINGDRLIVLGTYTPALSRSALVMIDRLHAVPVLQKVQIMSWIETLPVDRNDINRFVVELAF